MAFDGMVMKKVVSELSTNLIEGKINRIFQPTPNDLILGIYSGGKNYAMTICIDSQNCRFHLTTTSKPNPLVAPNFCMFLRKHILGYRIKSFKMDTLERVVILVLEGYNELNDLKEKHLVIELMGKHSNVILLNDKEIILDSLRHLDTSSHSYREILPAHPYTSPDSDKLDFSCFSNFELFYEWILQNKEEKALDHLLANSFIGFSRFSIQILLQDLALSNVVCQKEDYLLIYTNLQEIIKNLDTKQTSCKKVANTKGKLDYAITLKEDHSLFCVNFFLDDFYHEKEEKEILTQYRNQILKRILEQLKKYQVRLQNIEQKLVECDGRDIYQRYGELITANLYQIKQENAKEITLNNYYTNSPITIPLDPAISIAYNAKKYFRKYQKLKNALVIVNEQKKDTEKELDYLESIIYEIDNCQTIQELNAIFEEIAENVILKEQFSSKKKETRKKNRQKNTKKEISAQDLLTHTIDGHTVFVGKNNQQNDYLTTKLAHSNDLWFHTKDIHGSHVILKTNGEEIEDRTLIQCAILAASHSKGKLSSNVPVDYCLVRYVKKPSGSKPGMVIYTHNKTLYVNPQEEID